MPFRLRKAPKRELYWVVGPDGKHHSKEPLPKARAEAQMKALYASERREDEARIPTAREEKQIERKMEGGGLTDEMKELREAFLQLHQQLQQVGLKSIEKASITHNMNQIKRLYDELERRAKDEAVEGMMKLRASGGFLHNLRPTAKKSGMRGGYISKVQDKPDVIDRLEDIAVVKRSKGYYVYANDPETREAKKWGPFTKKVAEFEKRLLHQRQRHHLQPITEELEGEGGVRGGVGTVPLAKRFFRQVNEFLNPIVVRDFEGLGYITRHIRGEYTRLKERLRALRGTSQQDEKIRLVGQWAVETINYVVEHAGRDREEQQEISDRLHTDLLVPFLEGLGYDTIEEGEEEEEEGEEEEGVGAPAPEPDVVPAVPAPERAAFPPMRPRGSGKMRGGIKYSLTKEGSKQYNAWSNSNISKEVITLTELNRLKNILTENSDIPPDTIQNIVLQFGIDWNQGIQRLMGLLDEDKEGTAGVKIGMPPQPARRGRGKKVCMPKKDFLAEHKQLAEILAHPSQAKLRKELVKQTAEVKKMRGKGKNDVDFPVVRKGDKMVELSGPRTVAYLSKKRREKEETERRIREEAERQEALRIARQRQIDAADEERQRERRRAESRSKVSGFGQSAYLRKVRTR